jgi:hypothetical protein
MSQHLPTSTMHLIIILIIIPRILPPLIIRVLDPLAPLLHTFRRIVPGILDPLDLLAGPMRRVLGEVLDIVDGVVPALLDVVAEVLDVPDGAAGGRRGVLG